MKKSILAAAIILSGSVFSQALALPADFDGSRAAAAMSLQETVLQIAVPVPGAPAPMGMAAPLSGRQADTFTPGSGKSVQSAQTSWRADSNSSSFAGYAVWATDAGVNWRADRNSSGHSGFRVYMSDTGITLRADPNSCRNYGCSSWSSNTGITWQADLNSCRNSVCLNWRSNEGGTWRADPNSCRNTVCLNWSSNTGIKWRADPNSCRNEGCMAWSATAPDSTFLPFIFQGNPVENR